jgi:hypothetical protein
LPNMSSGNSFSMCFKNLSRSYAPALGCEN